MSEIAFWVALVVVAILGGELRYRARTQQAGERLAADESRHARSRMRARDI